MESMVPSIEAYRAIFDAAPDGCLVVDPEGAIREVNTQTERLFGWPREELLGQTIDMLVPSALRDGHAQHRHAFARHPRRRPMAAGLELTGQRRDGTTFPAEISLSPWEREGGEVWVVCAIRDVSAQNRLKNFSEGALRATEDERQRIARELHDDTAQRLATLILRVRVLAEEADSTARRALLEQIRAEIVEAAEGVKRIARGLRPPELEEVGLAAAVHAHVRSLREGTDFQIEASLAEVDAHLGMTAKLALYRIIQEALSNVMRHSEAASARVILRKEGTDVIVEVRDSGQGFEIPGPAGDGRGLGIVGMHERASMIGARLSLESVPGEGTNVKVTIPCAEPADG
jgi:PAS domain S-box-containing protein